MEILYGHVQVVEWISKEKAQQGTSIRTGASWQDIKLTAFSLLQSCIKFLIIAI